ncbi:DUF1640 domain-containing protein (plasmid) [Borrelia coriaceae]|uniref:BDR-repeat family protein n=1 Tax=Borrelia coriaceae ATCC 43381 TaxID=1408429 RepID=W5SWZ3_9SPIR|nr:Bdr family repetitive protein [Borrelia coriaceae]AHH11420.1 BDR-repeat family protein [Borrelia coriaceae ATCC 43381]UPA17421.1 DUF1640 domain-containing protein [Borrelia coriaceae]
MGLAQSVITQQMVISELIKAGINREIAIDLSYRYYKNELTYKDLEYLENTFNLMLDKVEALLQSEIKAVKIDLDNKIENVKSELKSDIKDLDNKVDNLEINLNVNIENIRSELKLDIKDLDNKIENVRSELKSDIKDLDNKIDVKFNELDIKINNLEKNNKWIFGLTFALWLTVLGGFIALIFK